jgi:hypothetical protein
MKLRYCVQAVPFFSHDEIGAGRWQPLHAVNAPLARTHQDDTGTDPQQVLANAGYRSEATLEALRFHPAELIIALGREGKN